MILSQKRFSTSVEAGPSSTWSHPKRNPPGVNVKSGNPKDENLNSQLVRESQVVPIPSSKLLEIPHYHFLGKIPLFPGEIPIFFGEIRIFLGDLSTSFGMRRLPPEPPDPPSPARCTPLEPPPHRSHPCTPEAPISALGRGLGKA